MRTAYANERFASSIPGWKTDRGRIYIIYGPPDEIESHPAGEAGRFPYERWLYHHINGIFSDQITVTFVDRTGSGDYQITPEPNSR